jgi:hypothetical protein
MPTMTADQIQRDIQVLKQAVGEYRPNKIQILVFYLAEVDCWVSVAPGHVTPISIDAEGEMRIAEWSSPEAEQTVLDALARKFKD